MDMIQSIREAFNELLNENHWMDDQTRIVAKAKADAMKERIGYPELLTDPDELEKEYIMVSVYGGLDPKAIRYDFFCYFTYECTYTFFSWTSPKTSLFWTCSTYWNSTLIKTSRDSGNLSTRTSGRRNRQWSTRFTTRTKITSVMSCSTLYAFNSSCTLVITKNVTLAVNLCLWCYLQSSRPVFSNLCSTVSTFRNR